jgi:hypothetical protein
MNQTGIKLVLPVRFGFIFKLISKGADLKIQEHNSGVAFECTQVAYMYFAYAA